MVLVTGATGSLGNSVINFLINKGLPAKDIAALVRNNDKASQLINAGVKIINGNYDDYNSLLKAFQNIDKLLFVSASEIENRDSQHQNVVNAAKEAGVNHIIYISFDRRSDSESTPIDFLTKIHIETEKNIIDTGINYTFLRNAIYAEFIPTYIGDDVLTKGIFIPAEDGKVPFASRTDMAEAAANVLMTNGHENKFYKTVNNTNYSFQEIADILSDISGNKVEYLNPTVNVFYETLLNAGVPQKSVCSALGWISTFKQGYFESDTSDLQKLLGRKPTPLKTILAGIYK